MYHLDSTGSGHGYGLGAAYEFTGSNAEDRAGSLATGKKGVAHGFLDLIMMTFEWNGCVEGLVDGNGFLDHVGFEVESGFWFMFMSSESNFLGKDHCTAHFSFWKF